MRGNKKAGGREPYINLCHNVIDMHMYKGQFNNANDVTDKHGLNVYMMYSACSLESR